MIDDRSKRACVCSVAGVPSMGGSPGVAGREGSAGMAGWPYLGSPSNRVQG